jgi:hypothetical protein
LRQLYRRTSSGGQDGVPFFTFPTRAVPGVLVKGLGHIEGHSILLVASGTGKTDGIS